MAHLDDMGSTSTQVFPKSGNSGDACNFHFAVLPCCLTDDVLGTTSFETPSLKQDGLEVVIGVEED